MAVGVGVGVGSLLVADWSAGFGEVVTRVWIKGRDSFRFEVTPVGGSALVFGSCHDVAVVLYHSGVAVSRGLSSERVAELIVASAGRGDCAALVWWDLVGDRSARKRYEVCVDLAYRLISLTQCPRSYPGYPQWHPSWRVNALVDRLAGVSVGAVGASGDPVSGSRHGGPLVGVR